MDTAYSTAFTVKNRVAGRARIIAGHAGFADQSHFTTAFRKVTSMTPKKFRNLTSAGRG